MEVHQQRKLVKKQCALKKIIQLEEDPLELDIIARIPAQEQKLGIGRVVLGKFFNYI
jgi:hypothetical protein